jgi:Lhr-like helicase
MPRHELTAEERTRGREGRAATFRERRERAERAEEELLEALDRATLRLIELIDSPDPAVALRAVTALFDRVLGRPRQMLEHSGSLSMQARITAEAPLARAKLDTLIERKARTMAGNGDGDVPER